MKNKNGMAFIDNDSVYVSSSLGNKIRLYDATGKYVEGIIDNKKHTWRSKIRKNIIEFLFKILIYLLRKEIDPIMSLANKLNVYEFVIVPKEQWFGLIGGKTK